MTVDIKTDVNGFTQYTAMSDEFLIQDDPSFDTPPLYIPDFVFDAESREVRFDGFRPVASNQADVIEGQVDIMREIVKAHKNGGNDDDDGTYQRTERD